MFLLKRFESIANFLRMSVLGVNCLAVITTCIRAQAVPERLVRDDRIGVCTHFSQNWPVEQIMPLIARSGAGWIRDDLGWGGLEPKPGNYQIPSKTKNWIHVVEWSHEYYDVGTVC
jgi:hypothetical protein